MLTRVGCASGAAGSTNNQILQRILSSADDLGLLGWDPLYGYGKGDVFDAVRVASEIQIYDPGRHT